MIHCSTCDQKRDTTRTPKGWKRLSTTYYCKRCWGERYVLRAISMPVAHVGDWKDFRTDLGACWAATTQVSNWMMTQLYTRDVRRNGQEKLPPMKSVYLYPEARALFPTLPAQSVASLEQSVTAKYRKRRYGLLWTHAESLPVHRYPVPFPVHNQSWRCYYDESNRPWVSARIADKRWEIRLRGGARYKRQLGAFKQMVRGEAVRGELALYRVRLQDKPGYQIMVKMVAWLPRPNREGFRIGEIRLRTDAEHLLVGLNTKDDRLWHYHGDQIVDWAAEERRRRYVEDRRVEGRSVKEDGSRRLAVVKGRNRLKSAIHQASAALAKHAWRRRVAKVVYRDEERSFVPSFPWFELRDKLREKCEYYGIEFEHVAVGDGETTSEAVEEETS